MRYDVSINKGESLVVDLAAAKAPTSAPGTLQFDASVAQGSPAASKLVDVVQKGPRTIVLVNNRVVDPGRARATATVVNERDQHAARAKSGGTQEKTIRSPMPGRIVKVYVKAGDTVEIGAPLLVVEAMKMENELRAKASAVVDAVLVAAGQTVEMNAVLLQLR